MRGSSRKRTDTAIFYARPNLFVANLPGINNCSAAAGTDFVYCDPGSDVQYGGSYYAASPPVPNCASCRGIDSSTATQSTFVPNILAEVAAGSSMPRFSLLAGDILPPCDDLPPITITIQPPKSLSAVRQSGITTYLSMVSSSGFRSSLQQRPSDMISSMSPHPSTPPTSPSQDLHYATNPAEFLPCHPGAFLCASPDVWFTCTQQQDLSWSWTSPRNVAAGMMCLPSISLGGYRDDKYVAARPFGGCSPDGSIKCTVAGLGYMVCDHGGWVDMGRLAVGTKCVNGNIIAT